MSYCRWSCMNGYCDLYAYYSGEGVVTVHIASHRPPPGAPPDGLSVLYEDKFDHEEYLRRNEERERWREKNPSVPIDHLLAKSTFYLTNPEVVHQTFANLKLEGFVFPDYIADAIEEDLRDGEVY